MKINQIVVMPTGRLACITEITARQVYLSYVDDNDTVSFRRDTFDRLWGAGKIFHHSYKSNSAALGVQPQDSGHGRHRAQLTLSV